MTVEPYDLFQGPAVIIDDEIGDAATKAYAIATELEAADFPVLRRNAIPSDSELRHWHSMSMIVLDWDLKPRTAITDSSEGSERSSIPFGVQSPASAKRDPAIDAAGFVRKLMSQLYCPIFIVSNLGESNIRRELGKELKGLDRLQLDARVMIRSKKIEESALLDALVKWVQTHPAIYALKIWERGYEDAKGELFRDLQASSVEWPGILWRTSDRDGVDPAYALTETITRSLQHRLNPTRFDKDRIVSEASSAENAPLDSVRRVLHQQAVVPATRLHNNVMMPGDFFYDYEEGGVDAAERGVPASIDICITPACDLIARDGDTDNIRMLIVRAELVPSSEYNNREKRDKLLPDDSGTSLLLHHIVPDNAMYRVMFRNWDIRHWRDVKRIRRGRLLEPYVTLLQQRFAQYGQRQGVPRLPSRFYSAR